MKKILWVVLVVAGVAQANLLINGDFESGNVGFSSDYTFEDPAVGENRYTITTVNPWAGTFGVLSDHTSGSGNYMAVNAAETAANDFWIQDVAVFSGVEYTFSGYIANITTPPLPTIQLEINGESFANNTYTLQDASLSWNQFSFTWTASATETVTLSLNEITGIAGGDDFAIDDLSLVPEPASALLVAVGGMLAAMKRRYFSGV